MRKIHNGKMKRNESRARSVNHRFDGHKIATGVNHNYDMRHAGLNSAPRTGQRHK